MRLHLLISRHGLPVTRILWTTTSSAALDTYGSQRAASASAIASSRTPNIAVGNGYYTIAQLLEDVNEVVPLETEPGLFDEEYGGGQWGLEDYVVEVAGSECLHFMEIEGLLRDGDQVVIRALQLSDLRARRLCGRHQISTDGKHLIDGVPFGLPFLKRTTSHRPAITIPPRKKRRISFSGWDQDMGYSGEPPEETSFGKELSVLPAEHEESDMGTVIRHPIDDTLDTESEAEDPDFEGEELESELRALKEDFEAPSHIETGNQGLSKRPSSAHTIHRGSLVVPSSLSCKHSRGDDSSPRTSKVVRFNKRDRDEAIADPGAAETPESSATSESSTSSSDSNDASDAPPDKDSEEDSSDSSSDSDDSTSEASSELSPRKEPHQQATMNPPGCGSVRTKKSNNRYKLRRRLSKLKELGALPADADFATLRAWEEANGGWYFPSEVANVSGVMGKQERKDQEQAEFEAKRQKLLRALETGGVDVDETSEKENVPPRQHAAQPSVPEAEVDKLKKPARADPSAGPSNRRSLDLASSRRLLFGSLGMRTPRTKEDEEEARRKLAAQASVVQPRKKTLEAQPVEEDQSESDVDWHDKLDIRATECVFDDIELSVPPFPFQQRWDEDSNALIRERKGWGKTRKRKRKQRIQVYNGDEEPDDEYDDGKEAYFEGDSNLNYDDAQPESKKPLLMDDTHAPDPSLEDLPALPDPNSVPDMMESDVKVGAIIGFRQLDMSKATNWQPVMSDYRVAEVHGVLQGGIITVRLAKRDRKPKPDTNPENDEPRLYSGFEMPGYDDDAEEDDGFREVAFAELGDSKLLRPAARPADAESAEDRAPSVVSVIEESLPNAQPIPAPFGMDVDEDTGVTLVTEASPHQAPPEPVNESASPEQPAGGVKLPEAQTQVQDGDDERNESSAVPSPLFSGFHSPPVQAQSSQQASQESPANPTGMELSNLDGQTLVAEAQQPVVADSSNLEFSGLSFASVNQPGSVGFENHGPEFQDSDNQHVSIVVPSSQGSYHSANADLAPFHDGSSPDRRGKGPKEPSSTKSASSWKNFLSTLADSGDEDEDEDEEEEEDGGDADFTQAQDLDSLVRDDPDLGSISPSQRSSRRPPRSGQDNSQSQPELVAVDLDSPAASTRSKRSLRTGDLPSASQPNPSQTSEVVDLTLSNSGASPSREDSNADREHTQASGWVSKPNADDDTIPGSSKRQTRTSSGKQRMVEVSISPPNQRKKRQLRKF